MPLVRISVLQSMAPERRGKLPRLVYGAMRSAIGIPDGDLFVALTPHAENELVFDPGFMGIRRTSDFTLIHITLRAGRPQELKQTLYREVARALEEQAGIAPADVMIVLAENSSADWSFGNGEAQYLLNSPAQGKS